MLQPRTRLWAWARLSPTTRVTLLTALAGACWLIFIGCRSSSDEGGYLLVASQWHPGTSLYGDYWVDRPPGLMAIFAVADALGGVVALRIIGALAVMVSVVLAGRIGTLVARPREAWLPAAAAAAVLSTPLLEGGRVNGEILATPVVLAGVLAAIRADRTSRLGTTVGWAALAGICATLAVSVKQNFIDVAVFVLVLTLVSRSAYRLVMLCAAAAVAAGTGVVVLAAAATRGTSPKGLWDALVMFRLHADGQIADAASSGLGLRITLLATLALLSLVPLVALACLPALRHPSLRADQGHTDLRWPAVALLGWEMTGIVLGGNFSPHYLLGTTAGLVLLIAAAAQRWDAGHRPGRRLVTRAVVAAVVSTCVAVSLAAVAETMWSQDRAAEYLRSHAKPGDTAVTAFGAPSVLQQAGLTSPYPYLWSLIVRVHDPQLHQFNAVLGGDDRPTWVIISGTTLTHPKLPTAATQRTLHRYYVHRTSVPGWTVLNHRFSTWSIYERRAAR